MNLRSNKIISRYYAIDKVTGQTTHNNAQLTAQAVRKLNSECFDINQSIAPMGSAYDLTGVNNYTSLNHFGNYQFPMSWATVVYFCKNPVAKLVFDLIETIQDNWNFYRHRF